MTVEPYRDRWYDDTIALAHEFHEEVVKEWVGELDSDFVVDAIERGRENGFQENAFLLIEDGNCQGLLYGEILNSRANKKLFFYETFLYVRKLYRRQSFWFLQEVERRLKERGIAYMVLSVLENYRPAALKRCFKWLGYRTMETQLVKDL